MRDLPEFLARIDKSSFGRGAYVKRVEKPWGYELYLVPEGGPYMSKIMHINEGCRQSLQVHDAKIETYTVLSGRVGLITENAAGEMIQIELERGHGYTTQVGQKHRLLGLSDCDIFEASTTETGTTWRLEDDYARPDETEEVRSEPDRGWEPS